MLYMWYNGKAPEVGFKKPQLLAAWNDAKNNLIEDNKQWTTEDQNELERTDSEIIQICVVEMSKKN